MRRAYERFVAVLQAGTAALCLAMLALVLLGVFYRYVVDDALSWYDEFAGYVLVWLTMYGSVLALAKRKHIGFETLVEKLPPRARRGVEAFGLVCIIAFSLVMVVSGWQLVREMEGETAVSIPAVKMAWVYSVMPITGGLMLLISAGQLVALLRPAPRPAAAPASGLEAAKPPLEGAR